MKHTLKYKNPFSNRDKDVRQFSYEQVNEALDYCHKPRKEESFIKKLAKSGLLDQECLKS